MTDFTAEEAIAAVIAASDGQQITIPSQTVPPAIGTGNMEMSWYRTIQRLSGRVNECVTLAQIEAAIRDLIPDEPDAPPVDDPYVPPKTEPVIDGGGPADPQKGGSVPLNPVNPGFESDLTGWAVGAAPAVVSSTWAVITDAPNAHGGSKFLRWTGDSTPPGGGVLNGLTYFNTTNVTTLGSDYLIVNVWARCKRVAAGGVGLTRARLGIDWYDAAGNQTSNTVAGSVALFGGTLDSGWTQISTFTAKTKDTAYFRAYVEAQGPAGSTVEFDDLTWNGAEP